MMRRRDLLSAAAGFGAPAMIDLQGAPPAGGGPETRLTAIHTMVEMPEWAPDLGKHWDPKPYIELCCASGVEIVEQKTKNEHGQALWPFRGRPCAHDWITSTRAEAKRAGIPYVAYYNLGLDNWMAKKRPEWCCVDAAGKPLIAFGAYNWMCFRSPWRDLVLDELRQVTEAIRPEAMWFDLLGTPNSYGPGFFHPALACQCPYCRAAYRKAYGEGQPIATDDAELRWRLNRFGHRARIEMLRDAAKLLRSIDANIWLGSNGAGFYDRLGGTPPDVQEYITFNSSEAKDHRGISFKAKSMWALGKPYQIHSYGGFMRMEPGSAVGTWAAWNLIPSSYLEVSAAVAAAHGGRLSVGVNPLPDGTFCPDELKNLAAGFQSVRAREPYLVGLQSVPNIAVVYDATSELSMMRLAGARRGLPVQQETMGLHHALLDAGMHFDVVNSDLLEPRRYSAVLLGDAVCPAPELLTKLRDYVQGGGLLIATNETSLRGVEGQRRPDFAWSDLFGVRFRQDSPFEEANYCRAGDELRDGAPSYPMLFRTKVLEVECTTARALAELVYPAAHRTKETYTDGETPYTHFGSLTGKPLITLNEMGKGKVVYIAAPIGREVLTRADTWLASTVARLVKRYAAPLAIESQAPTGVQVVFGKREGAYVISLLNHYQGLAVGAWGTVAPQVGPIAIDVDVSRLEPRPRAVKWIGAEGVRWNFGAKRLRINVDRIGHHAVLVLT
jgi:hypothetical protein